MTSLFKKLQFKKQAQIYILNSPITFENEIKAIQSYTNIYKTVKGVKKIEFVLTFVQSEIDIEKAVKQILPLLIDDGIFWFAYPKGTSKKYKVDINRDKGWKVLGIHEFEIVTAVSIDEDWSALRFKKVENIKTITRNKKITISVAGKNRAV